MPLVALARNRAPCLIANVPAVAHTLLFFAGFAAALWILLGRIFRQRRFPIFRILLAGGLVGIGYRFALQELFMRLGVIAAHAVGLVAVFVLSCASLAVLLRDTEGAKLSPREVAKLAAAMSLVALALVAVLLAIAGFLLGLT